MAPAGPAPADPRVQERALRSGVVLDTGIILCMILAALWGNSLSMLAEVMRAVPLLALGYVLLVLLMRINRGKLTAYDYGTRKVEQFANLLAGLILMLGALWLLTRLVGRYGVPQEQPALGLAFAAAIAAANLVINIVVFLQLWRAARGGQSLILNGQLILRFSKVIASAIVALAITVNAVFGPEGVGAWADLAGATIVIVVMLAFGWQLVRGSMPHLIDRALGEQQQHLINRALADHFDDFDALIAIRTRTEGRHAWIEVELGFAPERRLGEVTAVADRITAHLSALIPGARVLILIRGVQQGAAAPA